jgi:hypothetical protein
LLEKYTKIRIISIKLNNNGIKNELSSAFIKNCSLLTNLEELFLDFSENFAGGAVLNSVLQVLQVVFATKESKLNKLSLIFKNVGDVYREGLFENLEKFFNSI